MNQVIHPLFFYCIILLHRSGFNEKQNVVAYFKVIFLLQTENCIALMKSQHVFETNAFRMQIRCLTNTLPVSLLLFIDLFVVCVTARVMD